MSVRYDEEPKIHEEDLTWADYKKKEKYDKDRIYFITDLNNQDAIIEQISKDIEKMKKVVNTDSGSSGEGDDESSSSSTNVLNKITPVGGIAKEKVFQLPQESLVSGVVSNTQETPKEEEVTLDGN